MMPVIGNGLDASSTSSMKECMEKHHVRQMTNTALQKVNAHSFLVKYDGKEEELPFDYGFVCLGMRANAPIWNDIQEAFGKLSDEHIKYYELRARGGTGLLYVRDVSLTERMPDAIWY